MEHKICWECKEYLQQKYGPNFYVAPSNHCHHVVGPEKPKEKCWCSFPEEKRNNRNVSIRGEYGEPNPIWSITYCPVCGKPEERWGK